MVVSKTQLADVAMIYNAREIVYEGYNIKKEYCQLLKIHRCGIDYQAERCLEELTEKNFNEPDPSVIEITNRAAHLFLTDDENILSIAELFVRKYGGELIKVQYDREEGYDNLPEDDKPDKYEDIVSCTIKYGAGDFDNLIRLCNNEGFRKG